MMSFHQITLLSRNLLATTRVTAAAAAVNTNFCLKRSALVQYNYNTTAIQEFFSCIAVVLRLYGLLQ